MKPVEIDKSTVDDPLDVAAAVLESLDYELFPVEDTEYSIAFALPTGLGGMCSVVVSYLPSVGVLQMSAALIPKGWVNRYMLPGLFELLNGLNLLFAGIKFTYASDKELGDEIEVYISTLIFDEKALERDFKLMIVVLKEAVSHSARAVYAFLAQKPRVKFNLDGTVQSTVFPHSVESCLGLVDNYTFGRA